MRIKVTTTVEFSRDGDPDENTPVVMDYYSIVEAPDCPPEQERREVQMLVNKNRVRFQEVHRLASTDPI